MAYYRTKRGALFIGEETSFGAGSAALEYIKTKEVGFPAGMEYSPADDIVQEDTEDQGTVLYGPGDVTFKMGLHPVKGSTWPTAKPVLGSKPPISLPLEAIMGGVKAGGYGVLVAGSTTTVLKFDPDGDTPTVMGFVEGEPVYVRTAAAANVLGVNVAKDVDDVAFTVTLRSPLPSAPAVSAIVYGGYCWPKLSSAISTSYELKFLGEASTDVRQSLGCFAGAGALAAPHRGKGELSLTFHSAQPVPLDVAEAGGSPAVQAYSYPDAAQVIAGGLYLWDGSSNHKLTGGIDIDFGVESVPVEGVHGTDPNGIVAYVMIMRTIRVKVDPAYVDNALINLFQNPADVQVLTGWFGRGPRVWMFQLPQTIMTLAPTFGDKAGVIIHPLEFGAAAYTGDTGTGGASDAADKPAVLGVLAG